MNRASDDAVGERVTIHIPCCQGDRLCVIFRRRDALIVRHRRIIDRIDSDADRRVVAVRLAVTDLEDKDIRTVVIRCRGVGQIRRRATERAVLRRVDDDPRERIVFNVRCRQGNRNAGVLIERDRLRIRHRRIIDRSEREIDDRKIAVNFSVIGFEGE